MNWLLDSLRFVIFTSKKTSRTLHTSLAPYHSDKSCVDLEAASYANPVVGELTIFTASVVVATSGVFLFPVSFLVCFAAGVAYATLYLTISGVLGNACWEGISRAVLWDEVFGFLLSATKVEQLTRHNSNHAQASQ